jgi:uncharacterized repeat protein (TIGR03803 family)
VNVNGTLYGTTFGDTSTPNSWGTLFSVTPSGVERVLHNFTEYAAAGTTPAAPLLYLKGGLYGTTADGGAFFSFHATSGGTAFVSDLHGHIIVLHSFGSGAVHDGCCPNSPLAYANGGLYGTTPLAGANNYGTVFEIVL